MDPEAKQAFIKAIATGVIGLGLALALSYFATGRARGALLYLGLAFTLAGAGMLLPVAAALGFHLVALLCILFACRESVRETRAHIARMREESRQREDAFGEYLETTTRKEVEEEERLKATH